MFKKLSAKLIIIFLLMFIALISTVVSSFLAVDTQKQHMMLSAVLGEQELIMEKIAAKTATIAQTGMRDKAEFKKDLESYRATIDVKIMKLDNVLQNMRDREYKFDGKMEKLKFRKEFAVEFDRVLNSIEKKWESIKTYIDFLLSPEAMHNSAMYHKKYEEFNELNYDIITNDLAEVIHLCRVEASDKKSISDMVQIGSLIIAFSILFILIWMIISNFYNPIVEIKRIFKNMSKGKFNEKFKREKDDEFKELYDGFNTFIDKLNSIFDLENKIILEEKLEIIARCIEDSFQEFIPFKLFGIKYIDNNKTLVSRLMRNRQVEETRVKDGELLRYDKIEVVNNRIVLPIVINKIYLGYVFFELDKNAIIEESYLNFFELVKDKLSIAFYKSFLVKDLLSIVTGTLSNLTESRDPETGAHLIRMSSYSAIIAKKLYEKGDYSDEIDRTFIENIKVTSPMHDIGKVATPDRILLKPGKLEPKEFEIMKAHAPEGGKVLTKLHDELSRYGITYFHMAAEIAFGHHEKWDGSGYPRGLKGEEIPLPARIVAVGDVFDALTSKRPYKEAFSLDKSYEIIKELAGTHFDQYLVEIFFEAIEEILDIYNEYKEI